LKITDGEYKNKDKGKFYFAIDPVNKDAKIQLLPKIDVTSRFVKMELIKILLSQPVIE